MKCTDSCTNGLKDNEEEDVDCGGSCDPCPKCEPGNTKIYVKFMKF